MGANFTILTKVFQKEMTPIVKLYEPFTNKTTAEEVINSKHAMRIAGKTILVTGGSSGLGKESVKRFYQANANIIMLNRNLEKSKKVEKEIKDEFIHSTGSIRTIICDFASLKQSKEAADILIKEKIKIDILLLNAGVMMSPKKVVTEDNFELQMAINHFNQFAFMMEVLPLMNQNGRIVLLSSSGHTLGTIYKSFDIKDLNFEKREYSPNFVYFQTKLCNLMTSNWLNHLLKDDPRKITVNALRPGAVDTNLGNENPESVKMLKNMKRFNILKPVEVGASTQVFACVDKRLEGIGGKYFDKCAEHEVSKGYADNIKLQEELFNISLKLTNSEFHTTTSKIEEKEESEEIAIEN